MELSKHYEPAGTEAKWYAHWTENRYFNSSPDSRVPFTVGHSASQCNGSASFGTYPQ